MMATSYGSFPAFEDEGESDSACVHKQHTNQHTNRRKSRSETFDKSSEPFKDNDNLRLNDDEVKGAVWFMNPTRATFTYLESAEGVQDALGGQERIPRQQHRQQQHEESDIHYEWTSRNNRKGRHALVVHQHSDQHNAPRSTTSFSAVANGIWRMVTLTSWSDISYLNAIAFTVAVVILLGNAVLSVLPYTVPGFTSPTPITIVQGALTLIGCVVFLVSSFLSFIEAVNANKKGCVGWKRESSSDADSRNVEGGRGAATRMVPDWHCIHQRNNFSNLFHRSSRNERADEESHPNHHDSTTPLLNHDKSDQADERWRFFPTRHDLRQHFIYDLGFITCTILLLSSITYCSAALASFISILTIGQISPWIRIPQIIAGLGFMTCSVLFMIEMQTHWLVPEIGRIGWQISFWNFIGSVGFTLCAVFALAAAQGGWEWSENQMAYSYLCGSSGFMLGSLLQWYESLDKHPVEYKS